MLYSVTYWLMFLPDRQILGDVVYVTYIPEQPVVQKILFT